MHAYILHTPSKNVAEDFHISCLNWSFFTLTTINMRSYVSDKQIRLCKAMVLQCSERLTPVYVKKKKKKRGMLLETLQGSQHDHFKDLSMINEWKKLDQLTYSKLFLCIT